MLFLHQARVIPHQNLLVLKHLIFHCVCVLFFPPVVTSPAQQEAAEPAGSVHVGWGRNFGIRILLLLARRWEERGELLIHFERGIQ